MTGFFSEDVSPYFKRNLWTLLPGRYKDTCQAKYLRISKTWPSRDEVPPAVGEQAGHLVTEAFFTRERRGPEDA
jgi:hypothetical protein